MSLVPYTEFLIFDISDCLRDKTDSLFPRIELEIIDWFITLAPPGPVNKAFLNLKSKRVVKPDSILCFKECQRAPDLR